ncbi:MAG: energy-coupling factor transporter transmembrane component T family protein [Oscillospiraceae bacterium]
MGNFLQYVDTNSFLHRIEPRTKFLFFVVMSVVTSFVKSGLALLFLLVVFAALWGASRVLPYFVKLLVQIKVLLIFIFGLWLILGMFQQNIGPVIVRQPFTLFGQPMVFSLEWFDFYKGGVYALRVFLMISAFYTVILTTNFSQIIQGLNAWHLPYPISFGIGLIFQIIPMIIQEFSMIMEAQSSRGLEVEHCGAITKMKNYIVMSAPLLFRVLGKGHAISLAMYYYKLDFKKKRTSYHSLPVTAKDYAFVAALIVVTGLAVALQVLYYIPL